jgi:1-deoxy-D-xylulose-5-phosphate synthase
MLAAAIALNGPAAIRYPRGSGLGLSPADPLPEIPIGRGIELQSGDDLTIVAIGPLVHAALEAAQALAREGISAQVINARFVKPLDTELILGAVRRTGRLLTIEEHVHPGGFGSAVLEALTEGGLTGVAAPRVCCLAVPDTVVRHGIAARYREQFGLTAAGIAAASRELMQRE